VWRSSSGRREDSWLAPWMSWALFNATVNSAQELPSGRTSRLPRQNGPPPNVLGSRGVPGCASLHPAAGMSLLRNYWRGQAEPFLHKVDQGLPLTTAPNHQALRRREERAASTQHDIGGLPCSKDSLLMRLLIFLQCSSKAFKACDKQLLVQTHARQTRRIFGCPFQACRLQAKDTISWV
jgi:hypothetical protein